MPQWVMELLLALLGSATFTGGIGWWFKTSRDDRLARDLERKQDKLADLAKIEKLQQTLSDWQQKRIADEENKRREVDVSNKLLLDITVLLKEALKSKGQT